MYAKRNHKCINQKVSFESVNWELGSAPKCFLLFFFVLPCRILAKKRAAKTSRAVAKFEEKREFYSFKIFGAA